MGRLRGPQAWGGAPEEGHTDCALGAETGDGWREMEILSLGRRLSSLCLNFPCPGLALQGLAAPVRTLPALSPAWRAGLTAISVSLYPASMATYPPPPGWGPSVRQLGPPALCGPACTGVSAAMPPSCNSASCLGGLLEAELELCEKGRPVVQPGAEQLWFKSQLCHFVAM